MVGSWKSFLGRPIFKCYVSFREGKHYDSDPIISFFWSNPCSSTYFLSHPTGGPKSPNTSGTWRSGTMLLTPFVSWTITAVVVWTELPSPHDYRPCIMQVHGSKGYARMWVIDLNLVLPYTASPPNEEFLYLFQERLTCCCYCCFFLTRGP